MSEKNKNDDSWRNALRFWLACVALSAFLFGLRFIDHYFESTIDGTASEFAQRFSTLSGWANWTIGMSITVFYGSFMIGALILAFPWALLEKNKLMKRAKNLAGL